MFKYIKKWYNSITAKAVETVNNEVENINIKVQDKVHLRNLSLLEKCYGDAEFFYDYQYKSNKIKLLNAGEKKKFRDSLEVYCSVLENDMDIDKDLILSTTNNTHLLIEAIVENGLINSCNQDNQIHELKTAVHALGFSADSRFKLDDTLNPNFDRLVTVVLSQMVTNFYYTGECDTCTVNIYYDIIKKKVNKTGANILLLLAYRAYMKAVEPIVMHSKMSWLYEDAKSYGDYNEQLRNMYEVCSNISKEKKKEYEKIKNKSLQGLDQGHIYVIVRDHLLNANKFKDPYSLIIKNSTNGNTIESVCEVIGLELFIYLSDKMICVPDCLYKRLINDNEYVQLFLEEIRNQYLMKKKENNQ